MAPIPVTDNKVRAKHHFMKGFWYSCLFIIRILDFCLLKIIVKQRSIYQKPCQKPWGILLHSGSCENAAYWCVILTQHGFTVENRQKKQTKKTGQVTKFKRVWVWWYHSVVGTVLHEVRFYEQAWCCAAVVKCSVWAIGGGVAHLHCFHHKSDTLEVCCEFCTEVWPCFLMSTKHLMPADLKPSPAIQAQRFINFSSILSDFFGFSVWVSAQCRMLAPFEEKIL